MSRMWTWALAAACVTLLVGCEEPGPEVIRAQGCLSKDLAGLSEGQVFDAALAELRQRCRVTDYNVAAGVIACEPEYLARGSAYSTKQLRVVSSPSDLRRVTRAAVREQPGGVRLDICVALERRDTASIRAYQAMRSPVDVPDSTPVTTEGRDPAHREVWTDVGRDYTMETELLAGVEARLGSPTTRPD